MKKSRLLGAVCACIFSLGLVTTANASLVSRLGGAAAYDDVQDITWVTDAALSGGIDTQGNQIAWAA
jgi:hypothetical protein